MRNIKIFADDAVGTNAPDWRWKYGVKGYTTNPTLLKTAGPVVSYERYARKYLELADGLPVSFEVLAPRIGSEMERQACTIAGWGDNVYAKIPIIDADGAHTWKLMRALSHNGVRINATVIFTPQQLWDALAALRGGAPSIVSIFAGRIADTGADPTGMFNIARKDVSIYGTIQILWASARQVYDVVLAEHYHADIITLPPALLAKLPLLGKSPEELSLETSREFAAAAEGVVFA
jgi:transaldolase